MPKVEVLQTLQAETLAISGAKLPVHSFGLGNLEHFGGDVAAPVFASVMAGALRSLGVAPDAPLAPLQIANAEVVKEGI